MVSTRFVIFLTVVEKASPAQMKASNLLMDDGVQSYFFTLGSKMKACTSSENNGRLCSLSSTRLSLCRSPRTPPPGVSCFEVPQQTCRSSLSTLRLKRFTSLPQLFEDETRGTLPAHASVRRSRRYATQNRVAGVNHTRVASSTGFCCFSAGCSKSFHGLSVSCHLTEVQPPGCFDLEQKAARITQRKYTVFAGG